MNEVLSIFERFDLAVGERAYLQHDRYLKIFQMLSDGANRKNAAAEANFSVRTVEAIITRVRDCFGCKSETHLIAFLLRNGLIN